MLKAESGTLVFPGGSLDECVTAELNMPIFVCSHADSQVCSSVQFYLCLLGSQLGWCCVAFMGTEDAVLEPGVCGWWHLPSPSIGASRY